MMDADHLSGKLEASRMKWDEFASIFQKHIERSLKISAFSLFTFLRLNEAKSVLEVGCGAGGAGLLAQREFLQKGSKFHMVDLSPKMVELATATMQNGAIEDGPVASLAVCSVEKLPFPDASFDRLWGNYMLHVVPDPELALRECYRVTAAGGIVGFTVWGRSEICSRFWIPERAKTAIGHPPEPHPGFKLSNKDLLQQKMLKTGFKTAMTWYQCRQPK